MKLNPYIMFSGNAATAMEFYKECLGGEITGVQRFGDAPMPTSDDDKDRILHATFTFDDNVIMFSDSMKANPVPAESNIHLSVDVDDAGKLDSVFSKMSEGGKVDMALQDTFWGARFGMLTDKFGVHWMFNHELKK